MIDSLDILNTNDAIEHHGIKGMHWGIRRTPEQLGHIISRKKEKFEKYSKKATQAAEKGNLKTFEKYKKKTEKKFSVFSCLFLLIIKLDLYRNH